jgi:CBS domain-containing protein
VFLVDSHVHWIEVIRMILDKALLDIPIKDAAAHIFRRPFLFVNPTAHMLQIATFLAIGPQIYADGLIVINESNNKPIGRISSKHIISNIINTGYPKWLETTALQIMDDFAGIVDMNSSLSKVLEVFDKTRFAFVVIVSKGNDRIDSEHDSKAVEEAVVASLSIRDILPLIAKMNIDIPIRDLCRPLISVDKNTSVRSAIDFMMKNGIRNIGIRDDGDYSDDISNRNNRNNNNKTKLLRTINDRKILEFLLSDKGKQIMRKNGIAGLADVNIINHLDMISTNKVKYGTTTSEAAELLTHIDNPCLILENEEYGNNYSIVTPWDIVMKTRLN